MDKEVEELLLKIEDICKQNDCNISVSTTTNVMEHKLELIEAKITKYDEDLKLIEQDYKKEF